MASFLGRKKQFLLRVEFYGRSDVCRLKDRMERKTRSHNLLSSLSCAIGRSPNVTISFFRCSLTHWHAMPSCLTNYLDFTIRSLIEWRQGRRWASEAVRRVSWKRRFSFSLVVFIQESRFFILLLFIVKSRVSSPQEMRTKSRNSRLEYLVTGEWISIYPSNVVVRVFVIGVKWRVTLLHSRSW